MKIPKILYAHSKRNTVFHHLNIGHKNKQYPDRYLTPISPSDHQIRNQSRQQRKRHHKSDIQYKPFDSEHDL